MTYAKNWPMYTFIVCVSITFCLNRQGWNAYTDLTPISKLKKFHIDYFFHSR